MVPVSQSRVHEWAVGMAEEVRVAYPGEVNAEIEAAMRETILRATVLDIAGTQQEANSMMSIARTGYLFRRREMDIMEVASAPSATAKLRELRAAHPEWTSWADAVVDASQEFAWLDDEQGPDPAPTLDFLSIGREGRSMAAQMFVAGMTPEHDELGVAEEDDYLRAWKFGWYLAAFEAAAPAP